MCTHVECPCSAPDAAQVYHLSLVLQDTRNENNSPRGSRQSRVTLDASEKCGNEEGIDAEVYELSEHACGHKYEE